MTQASKRPADYVLSSRKVLEGKEIDRVLHSNTTKISIVRMEKPSVCPICLSTDKIAYYRGTEGHFRCTVCQHIWG